VRHKPTAFRTPYVRLKNADAAGEIDPHMADDKLLRILVAVFLIDIVWSMLDRSANYSRIVWDIVLVLLSFVGAASQLTEHPRTRPNAVLRAQVSVQSLVLQF
jgi:hypothetical protein